MTKTKLRFRAMAMAAAITAPLASGWAQDEPPVPRLIISDEVCRALVAHEPAADVAYQPGVDVLGRPVVAADLPGAIRFDAPEDFVIPITRDLDGQFGFPEDTGVFEGEAIFGTVAYVDGQLFFDGQPLFDPAQALIARLCRERGR